MTDKHYDINLARDLANDINNISLFINSGAWQKDSNDMTVVNLLFDQLQEKIDSLQSCLSFLSAQSS